LNMPSPAVRLAGAAQKWLFEIAEARLRTALHSSPGKQEGSQSKQDSRVKKLGP
jgi:hypothetical protein